MNFKAVRKSIYGRFVPFLAWFPELRNKETLRADIIAGITVALVLIPQSMAYARLAGLEPIYGLYAAFLPPMVAALFGSSRQLATGPVAVVSLLTQSALAPIASADPTSYVLYAILLAFLVGLFQLSLGLLRLGVLLNFLSHPVVVGFTNAAAIIIATSQLNKIFGVEVAKSPDNPHFVFVWDTLVAAFQYIHWPTFFVAALAFAIMIVTKRYYAKIPYVLLAVAITTILSWLFKFHEETTITLKQVGETEIQETIKAWTGNSKRITAVKAELRKADELYQKNLATFGDNHIRTLRAKNQVTIISSKLKVLTADNDALFRNLKHVKLGAIPGAKDQPETWYQQSNEKYKDAFVTKRWHVKKINDTDKGLVITLAAGGKIVQDIKSGLPGFKIPTLEWSAIGKLFVMAIIISLIGFMEAISIAKAMASRTRQRLDANQELVGQGISNIVGSFFQSYAVSGSFSRSAVNISAGAVTGFSSVVTSIVVMITLLFLTPLLYHLPEATLAAVIMMAVIGLVNITAVKHAWHANRDDGIVAIVTFALTLLFAPHLEKGIVIGIALSLILFLWRTMEPRLIFLSKHQDGTMRDAKAYGLPICENIAILRFEGSLYFANVAYLEEKIQKAVAASPDLKFLIIDGVSINHVDATGEEMLREISRRMNELDIELLFTRIKKPILDTLEHTHFISEHGREHFFRKPELALEYAWSKLDEGHKERCPLHVTPSSD